MNISALSLPPCLSELESKLVTFVVHFSVHGCFAVWALKKSKWNELVEKLRSASIEEQRSMAKDGETWDFDGSLSRKCVCRSDGADLVGTINGFTTWILLDVALEICISNNGACFLDTWCKLVSSCAVAYRNGKGKRKGGKGKLSFLRSPRLFSAPCFDAWRVVEWQYSSSGYFHTCTNSHITRNPFTLCFLFDEMLRHFVYTELARNGKWDGWMDGWM